MTQVAYGVALPSCRGVLTPQPAPWWVPAGSTIFADIPNGRYWAARRVRADFASWLAACGGTFSGPAGRAYTTAANAIVTAALNVPRMSYAGGVPYLLYEPAATNICLNSGTVGGAGWNTYTAGAATLGITANAAIAPDGTSTATLVALNRSNATSDRASVYRTLTLGSAGSYAGSLYVKAYAAGDVGKTVSIYTFEPSTGVHIVTITLTSAWQRTSDVATLASGSGQIGFGYFNGDGGSIGATNLLIWGPQMEAGVAVSSYISTATTAVTRSAETIGGLPAPSGLMVTFDDGFVQTITSAAFAVSANLNRPTVARIVA